MSDSLNYTKQISNSKSLGKSIGTNSITNSSSEQGIQYIGSNNSVEMNHSNTQQNGNNLSTMSTEDSIIIEPQGFIRIIQQEKYAVEIMKGRNYNNLTKDEKTTVCNDFQNKALPFIIDYAKNKYLGIRDVYFADHIDKDGKVKSGPYKDKDIKELTVKECIQLSGKNRIQIDDNFLNLSYGEFKKLYWNKVKEYLTTNNA